MREGVQSPQLGPQAGNCHLEEPGRTAEQDDTGAGPGLLIFVGTELVLL